MNDLNKEIKDGLSDQERVELERHLVDKMLELKNAQNLTPLAYARMQP